LPIRKKLPVALTATLHPHLPPMRADTRKINPRDGIGIVGTPHKAKIMA
jgi:hypothetical protein